LTKVKNRAKVSDRPREEKMLTFLPPRASSDKGRRRVFVGNGKTDVHIGWIDESGFYPRIIGARQTVLSPGDLTGLGQEVALEKQCRQRGCG